MKNKLYTQGNKILIHLTFFSILGLTSCFGTEKKQSVSQLSDTISSVKFVDNYMLENPNEKLYTAYDKMYIWGTIEIADRSFKVINRSTETIYSMSFTNTLEKTPKPVLIYHIKDDNKNLSRTFFLDQLVSEENLKVSQEFAEGFNDNVKTSSLIGYRFQSLPNSDGVEKIKVNIIIHSKRKEVIAIQIAEPFKKIFNYFP